MIVVCMGLCSGRGEKGSERGETGVERGGPFYLVEELSFSINSAIEFPDVLKNFLFFFF
jgi:hypothetical protein